MKLRLLLLAGVGLAAGCLQAQTPPETNRFTQEVLDEKLNEPTELAVAPDGRVFYIERKGKVKSYSPAGNPRVKEIGQLPVYHQFEYGLMGLALDPQFATNHWIYLYYSPPSNPVDTAQRLSRFTFDPNGDTLDWRSEKILLRVPVKRNECCHTGGSLAWDRQGNLYLSTGDDVNPFDSDGYGPMDNRPEREGWDGRYTSSNTNDLRGKILRIKPQPDGTYTIPVGNLYEPGTALTRPEIYVMGCRNPYRIAVDQRTGFLYWGEVGPDAGNPSEKYGPRGYDEVNQARQAGYFGWPLFVADNQPYAERDFHTNATGPRFDAQRPVNQSPHNTGLKVLPPAQKAFIYYPYAESPEFGPLVGKGGRNAMGGPVYYFDDYDSNSTVKFPRYYDGKFFHYDWMRDWINVVTLSPSGDFERMERFLPGHTFYHPMDMQFHTDGSLYLLEYGPRWFAQNDEARLSRITFNPGNRPPVLVGKLSVTSGAAPLQVNFDASASLDYDQDVLQYAWQLQEGGPVVTQPSTSFTYTQPGIYHPRLKLTDAHGNTVEKTFEVRVGNAQPSIKIAVRGNQSFFWPQQPIRYAVSVTDKEDGATKNKRIPAEDVFVSINYLEGYDKTLIAQGHQSNTQFATGKRLIELSDCKSCHAQAEQSIGPSFVAIGKKYHGTFEIEGKLADKIIQGGRGVWGEQAMNAHPQVRKSDALEMVRYLLSLGDPQRNSQPLASDFTVGQDLKEGSYIFAASYTDRGNDPIPPNAVSEALVLRHPLVSAVGADFFQGTEPFELPESRQGVLITAEAQIGFKDLDWTGLKALHLHYQMLDVPFPGLRVEVRRGSATGLLVGQATLPATAGADVPLPIPLKKSKGRADLYLLFRHPEGGKGRLLVLDKLEFLPQ